MRRWPAKTLSAVQRLSWTRLLCGHKNWLRYRDNAGDMWRVCDHCGATIPGWDVTPEPTKEKR